MRETVAREPKELQHVDECVEEIIFLFMDAFVHSQTSTPAAIAQKRYDLPDKILEVVLRAREVPLLADVPDSRRPIE